MRADGWMGARSTISSTNVVCNLSSRCILDSAQATRP